MKVEVVQAKPQSSPFTSVEVRHVRLRVHEAKISKIFGVYLAK
jgi:hypothetical protein